MSPRRSSRARTTQPPGPGPVHTNSSTSSISSGRAERSTRSHHKLPSPNTSKPPRSLSLEDPDEHAKPQLRRTRSGHDDIKESTTQKRENDEVGEEAAEEEDVTRCVCGQLDYPGPPVPATHPLKQVAKEVGDTSTSSDPILEETEGLFVQCDTCKVWQHGSCVGIPEEGIAKDAEYFCEQCRKDLHELFTLSNGQRYSRYLPVQEAPSPHASPELSPKDTTSRKGRPGRAARPSAEALAHKRRSTMNSRDAAYDEAEQLRKAIEESKKEGEAPSIDDSSRRNKRSRSESEGRKDPAKRQRADSNSSSSPSAEKANPAPGSSSDEALAALKSTEFSPKKIRGAAARNHKEKELRDQRERERADAAGRRAARSERRRDSDPSEDPTSRTITTRFTDPTIPHSPDTPPASQDPVPRGSSHKKSGRPTTKRGRVGRNQYTKDRDIPAQTHTHARTGSQLDVGGGGIDTPLTRGRSRSRSNAGGDGGRGISTNGFNGNGTGHAHTGSWVEAGKPSKPKHMNPNRTSLNEMKRRVAGIMEFVSRTQSELEATTGRDGGTPPESGSSGGGGGTRSGGSASSVVENTGANGGGAQKGEDGRDLVQGVINGLSAGSGDLDNEQDFAGMSSAEMMRVLRGRLVGWQREYGVWGEK